MVISINSIATECISEKILKVHTLHDEDKVIYVLTGFNEIRIE